jgi:hypothetical protein
MSYCYSDGFAELSATRGESILDKAVATVATSEEGGCIHPIA